jgi:VCBS repeat-containing protein
VQENATLTGETFAITAEAGLAATGTALTLTDEQSEVVSLTLAQLENLGTVNQSITSDDGVLTLTGYSLAGDTATITYSFDPTSTSRDHSGGNNSVIDMFAIVATDNESDSSAVGSLDILITDTAPVAVADTNEIDEGFRSVGVSNTVTGNVYGATGASANDNADGTLVDAVSGDEPVTAGTFTGTYGSLVLGADGQYTYTVDNDNVTVDDLNDGESVVDVVTYTVTDGDGDVATSTLSVTINGETDVAAVAPSIDSGAGEVPESTGLLAQYYTRGTVSLDSSADAPSSAIEGILEAAAAATHVSRLTSGVGDGLLLETSTPSSTEVALGLGGEEAYSVTGLIYLEQGHSYEFSGTRDDSLHIELGGQVVVTTAGNSVGNFNSGVNDKGGVNSSVSTSTFVATESGYYTLEAYFGNIQSTGAVLLNLSDDGVVKELSADNYSLYASTQDLIAAGGQIGRFTSNDDATSDHIVVNAANSGFSSTRGEFNSGVGQVANSTDGGYFALAKDGDTFSYSDGSGDVDVVGVGTLADNITLSSLSVLPEGTDTISSIIIGDIPVGAILSDGVNSSDGIVTSQDIQGWNIANLTINLSGVSPAPAVDTAVTLTVEATSTSSTGKTATTASTISVGILDDAYLTDASPSGDTVDGIISGSFMTDTEQLILGSGSNDTLTASNAGPVVLHGLGGNDVLNGADKDTVAIANLPTLVPTNAPRNDFQLARLNGDNTIFAGSGDDTVVAGSGEDIIFAGTGSDLLTGGFANGSPESDTDTFVWREGDQGTGSEGANLETDTITDFVLGDVSTGADILDFSQLLIGEDAENADINDFITVSESGGDAILSIDVQGDGNTDYDFTVVLEGKGTLSLDTLIADGNVVFDGRVNTIRGITGADAIVGTTADDLIFENGTIGDGNGTTRAVGGGGNDTFIFESDDLYNGSRSYEIYDFFIGADDSERDVIDISAYLDGNQTAANIGDYIDIDFGGGGGGGGSTATRDIVRIFQDGDAGGSGTSTSGGVHDVQLKFRNDSSDLADSTPSVASSVTGYNAIDELAVLQALITDGYLIIN